MKTYGPYSPIRKAGDFYFVSGQVGIDPTTKQVAQDIASQTHQTLKNLVQLLQVNNLDINDIVKTTIYLKNMGDFAAMNDVYITYFDEPRPVRATVEVAGLPKLAEHELLIEIEAVAYQP